jgi:hypothetical protein
VTRSRSLRCIEVGAVGEVELANAVDSAANRAPNCPHIAYPTGAPLRMNPRLLRNVPI